jgi:hypothetical protein
MPLSFVVNSTLTAWQLYGCRENSFVHLELVSENFSVVCMDLSITIVFIDSDQASVNY